MLSREHVERILSENGYSFIFTQAVIQATQDWRDHVATNFDTMSNATPLERATFLNRRVVEIICENLNNDPNVVIYEGKQNTIITIFDNIITRFKKLNNDMRAINTITNRVKALWYQNQQYLPGEFSDWVNVTFGWQLDQLGEIQRLAVINEYNNRLTWLIEYDAQGIQQTTVEADPLFVAPEAEAELPYTLTPRNTERARHIAENDEADNENSIVE